MPRPIRLEVEVKDAIIVRLERTQGCSQDFCLEGGGELEVYMLELSWSNPRASLFCSDILSKLLKYMNASACLHLRSNRHHMNWL